MGDGDRRERLDEHNVMKIVVRFRSVERRLKASSASGCTIATNSARRKPVLWGIRQNLGPPMDHVFFPCFPTGFKRVRSSLEPKPTATGFEAKKPSFSGVGFREQEKPLYRE